MFAEGFLGEKCPLSSGKTLSNHLLSLSLGINGNTAQVVWTAKIELLEVKLTLTRADRCRVNLVLEDIGEQLNQINPETNPTSSTRHVSH